MTPRKWNLVKHGEPVIRKISDPEIHDVPSIGTRLIILNYLVIEWSFDGRLKYFSVGLLFPPKLTEADCPLSSRPAPAALDELIAETIGVLVLSEGFVPTAIRSEVMRVREKLQAALRARERAP